MNVIEATGLKKRFGTTQALDGAIGFKLEAAPLHPVIFASTVPGFGL